jgi:hypothetical protein
MNRFYTPHPLRFLILGLMFIGQLAFPAANIYAQLGKGPPITQHEFSGSHDILSTPRIESIPSLPSIESTPALPSSPSIEAVPSNPLPLSKQPLVTSRPEVAAGAVIITNEASRPLHFSIKRVGEAWGSYTVGAGQSMRISCNGCNAGTLEFSMSTEGREIRYSLDLGESYALQWSKSKDLWDIVHIKR